MKAGLNFSGLEGGGSRLPFYGSGLPPGRNLYRSDVVRGHLLSGPPQAIELTVELRSGEIRMPVSCR